MHHDDWRRRHPEFQTPRLVRNMALRDQLRVVAEARGTSVAAIALAWVLCWPQVTGTIVGASTAGQVDGWLPAASLSLTSAELDSITRAIHETGAGSGPMRPQASTTST
jgi:aryl-alcohol dehydrogenase-like predicted oxidoreductase